MPKFEVENLIPPKSERFDITTIYMAAADDVCPGLPQKAFEPDLEKCVKNLSLEKGKRHASLEAVDIGTFEDFQFGGSRNFKRRLKDAGQDHLIELLKGGKRYILGINIPGKYYSKREFGGDPNFLSFYGMRDFNLCIDGACDVMWDGSHGEIGTAGSRLLLKQPIEHARADIPAWILANDDKISIGFALNHGLFVAKDSKLYSLRKLFGFASIGRPYAYAFFLGAFFIICALIGFLTGYLDFSFLAYMVVSMATVILSEDIRYSLAKFDAALSWKILIGIRLNFLAASILFTLTALRSKARPYYIGGFTVLFFSVMFIYLSRYVSDSAEDIMLTWDSNFLPMRIYAISLATIPTLICLVIAGKLQKLSISSDKEDVKISLRSRRDQQLLIGITFFLLGLIVIYAVIYSRQYNALAKAFTPWGGLAVCAIATILLFNSLKRQTRSNRELKSDSESTRMEKVHGRKAAQIYRAKNRSSIISIIDLENSTTVTNDLDSDMHWVMVSLLKLIKITHVMAGFKWIYDKTNGDCSIVLLSDENGLKEDLKTVVTKTRDDINKYRKMLKFFDQRLDLHINILAVNSYRLGADPEPKTFSLESYQNFMAGLIDQKATKEISEPGLEDFIGSECNYLMKYIKDAPSGYITLGGSYDVFDQDLLSQAQEIGAVSSLMKATGKNEQAQQKADDLKLVYLVISETNVKTLQTDEVRKVLGEIHIKFNQDHKKAS